MEPNGKVFPFHSSSILSWCAGGCWFSAALAFSARLMSGREGGAGLCNIVVVSSVPSFPVHEIIITSISPWSELDS